MLKLYFFIVPTCLVTGFLAGNTSKETEVGLHEARVYQYKQMYEESLREDMTKESFKLKSVLFQLVLLYGSPELDLRDEQDRIEMLRFDQVSRELDDYLGKCREEKERGKIKPEQQRMIPRVRPGDMFAFAP